MTSRRAWVVAIVVALGACGKGSRAHRETSAAEDAAVAPAPAAAAWTGSMYSALAEKIAADCEQQSIPRLGSDEFAAIIDVRNLDAVDRPGEPARLRLPGMLDVNDGMRNLMWAYYGCGDAVEMIAVTMIVVEGMGRMMPLTDEFMAGISPDDPSYQTRVDGRERALSGLLGTIGGLVTTLRDPSVDVTPLEGIAVRLGAAFAAGWQSLPPDLTSVQKKVLLAARDEATDPARKAILQLVAEGAGLVADEAR